jgi:hypothetical protein
MSIEINLELDFSRFPAGRYRKDGPSSGQRFREDFLLPRLAESRKTGEKVKIVFDNVAGLPSSFLEEAFGGVIREMNDMSAVEFLGRLDLVDSDPNFQRYVSLIKKHITTAEKHRRKGVV